MSVLTLRLEVNGRTPDEVAEAAEQLAWTAMVEREWTNGMTVLRENRAWCA